MKKTLENQGYNVEKYNFLDVEYSEDLDLFLLEEVGYDALSMLSVALFLNPYSATSLNEYFSDGFLDFYLDSQFEDIAGWKPLPRARMIKQAGRTMNNKRTRRAAFDHVKWSNENIAEKEPVDYAQHARSLTDNNILAEVLADSQKTMINQMQAEKMGKSAIAGDFAERKVATSDPADLFGQAAGNWAALAFDD